ncbi:hypothetical protein ACXZ65_17175 [Streptomyces aculeolatus]
MDVTAELRTEVDNFLGSKRTLIDALTRQFRDGAPAKALARAVTPAFSRDQVTQYLSAVALHDAARKALAETGLDAAAEVRVTGIDAPREARLNIFADPAETQDYSDLPQQIRAALRDFHLTLDVTQDFPLGEDPRITEALVDEVLLDGEPARLVKATPRT